MTSYREVWDKMNELSLCECSFDELKVLVSTCLDSFENDYPGRNETGDLLNITYKYLNFVADEYHDKFLDAFQTTIQAGKELDSVRAELSRLKNPENPQYTDEEMEAMTNDMTIKELLS
jgi:hypothetical protein